jgi:hypothetical protein
MSKQSGGGRTPGRSDSKDSTTVDSDNEGDGEVKRGRLTLWKPKLKAPGTKRLKLNYTAQLSSFGFQLNLSRYSEGEGDYVDTTSASAATTSQVRRCRCIPKFKPVLNAHLRSSGGGVKRGWRVAPYGHEL